MSRKPVPLRTDLPYHLRARCNNREAFSVPLSVVWSVMEDYLYLTHRAYGVKIHSFVLMPNHFHLLAAFPNNNLAASMSFFMRETSREINRLASSINHVYGGRHKKSLIDNFSYLINVYKYIYRNPARANLCERVERYPYSTLSGLCGESRLCIPLVEDTFLFAPMFEDQVLAWLNTATKPTDDDEIRRGLKHSIFEPKPAKTDRKSDLDARLI